MTAKDLKNSLKEVIDKYNSLGVNQQLDYDKFY